MNTFLEIPWANNEITDFIQEVILDGSIFKIAGRYNTSKEFWTFDLFDQDDDPIFLGQKVVLGVNFLKRITKINRPNGSLLFVGDNKDPENIKQNDIPLKARLMYVY